MRGCGDTVAAFVMTLGALLTSLLYPFVHETDLAEDSHEKFIYMVIQYGRRLCVLAVIRYGGRFSL